MWNLKNDTTKLIYQKKKELYPKMLILNLKGGI